ncbi:2-amino-4-hydroxy-6-hydroxymethyldihydropteridine diphosphokinase [Halobacillus sp. Marseille-Q1614]|uniref:2-amino-4-hydroxy-6- hydroxymethyldihydropteridine diphosphokinase n=1 Tax=Halobacillus sp. Marseille-Q1614 TaxID=2709134 RepID=UPI00156FBF3B|nr:2-amino-4-hydroxy-6-hydroxymethyldihydropteridine diphosphokinase [Halobacillus sp. Marseille-Q1614]
MNSVYIALGSNLDNRIEYLTEAVTLLDHHDGINVVRQSSIYETAPVGYIEQNDFLNMVLEARTTLQPLELLDYCQFIEKELGRKRVIKWGPRTIDLDILAYNQENMKDERLTIPHPHLQERAFVLVPLAELDPNLYIPSVKQEAGVLLNKLPKEEVESIQVWIEK